VSEHLKKEQGKWRTRKAIVEKILKSFIKKEKEEVRKLGSRERRQEKRQVLT
jgi:hypothetical protein